MAKESLCYGLFYLAIAPPFEISTEALSLGLDLAFGYGYPSNFIDGGPFPVIDKFNTTDDFLDFYETFYVTKSIFQTPNIKPTCRESSIFKRRVKYTGRKVIPPEKAKEMLEMYETYKTINRKCICSTSRCLRKCCEQGKAFDLSKKECRTSNIFSEILFNVYNEDNEFMHNFNGFYPSLYGMDCSDTEQTKDSYYFRIQENGTFTLIEYDIENNEKIAYDANSFCLENFVENNELQFQAARVCGTNGKITNLSAAEIDNLMEVEARNQEIEYLNISVEIFQAFSILFLVITFLVYALIPELHDTHGKNSMCHTASLTTGYIFYSVLEWKGATSADTVCEINGFIAKFSILATFFWLNVMCFDVWKTFCYLRGNGHRRKGTTRFLIYSCYAWGGPTIILMIHLITEYSPLNHEIDANGKPICNEYILATFPDMVQMYSIVGFLLLLNTVLFMWTAVKIFVDKRKLKVLSGRKNHGNNSGNKSYESAMYLRLFLIMGVFWLIELVNGVLVVSQWTWFIGELTNSLQGFCIFFVSVLNVRVKQLVKIKLENLFHRMPRGWLSIHSRSSSSSERSFRNRTEGHEMSQDV